MTYDLSSIMRRAWEIIRKADVATFGLDLIKSRAMKTAWREAKQAAAEAAYQVVAVEDLTGAERELIGIENKNRQTAADVARMGELRRIVAQERSGELEAKRALIASAKGRICAVVFTKKDGTERLMKVQPAKLKFHVKGDAATEAGQKASATRAARHPNLLPVWDTEAGAPRSVNLATIRRIAVDGAVHHFNAH